MSKLLFRPKSFIMYFFPTYNAKCTVGCYPQQRWEQTNYDEDENLVSLKHKHITIKIPIEDFNENWKRVKAGVKNEID